MELDKDTARLIEDGKYAFLESEYGQYVLAALREIEEYKRGKLVTATSWDEVSRLQGEVSALRRVLNLLNLLEVNIKED